MKRDVAIEIFAPVEGIHQELGSSMITPRSTPYVKNCNSYYGAVQKEYGYSLLSTATGAILPTTPNFMYEALFPEAAALMAFTHTGMYKYSNAGTFANDGQSYHGTYTDFWDACIHNEAMVYCNGVDVLQYKPSFSSTGTDMGGIEEVGNYKAKSVVSFKNHLNIYGTVEGGAECPKRNRWTKIGLLDYATSDWNSGTAGFVDIQNMDGNILTAEKVGGVGVAIYGERSIHLQTWVGGDSVYQYDKLVDNINIPTRKCVAIADDIHYVFTRSGVYTFNGLEFTKISQPVERTILEDLNEERLDLAFMEYLIEDKEVRLYVPSSTATIADTCLIYKLEDKAWFKRNIEAACVGRLTRPTAITIGDLTDAIASYTNSIGAFFATATSPMYLLANSAGYVSKRDKTVFSTIDSTGGAVAQEFIFDTKDLSSISDIDPMTKDRYNISAYADNETRWLKTKMELKSNSTTGSAILQYSTDKGATFVNFPEGAKTVSTDWAMYQWDVDIAAPYCRVRLSNTATLENLAMRYTKVQFVPGGES